MANLNNGGLQAWILVEAYKNGLARLDAADPAETLKKDGACPFFVQRHDLYRRYFDLPADLLLCGTSDRCLSPAEREVRLRIAVLLCDSVRQLLKQGLIRFHHGRGDAAAPRRGPNLSASAIHLTEAGIRRAEALFAESQRFTSPDSLALYCPT